MPQISGTFKPEKVYDFNGIDQVSTLNGGLTLQIPIGPRYQSGGLEYGLTLSFNSAKWQHDKADAHCVITCGEESRLAQRQNAGAGWMISLGGLVKPDAANPPYYWNRSGEYIFFDSVGGEHPFFRRLHDGDAEDLGDPPGDGVQKVLYSRDGSYLRFKRTIPNPATGVVTAATVEYPDGRKLVFDDGGKNWAPGIWLPSQIEDAWGVALTISYHDEELDDRWEITDRDGRVQTVHFANGDPLVMAWVVTSVDLTFAAGSPARWTLGFSEGASLCKPWPIPTRNPCLPNLHGVPLLDRVTLPDGSWFEVSSYDTAGNPLVLRLPTGGEIHYDWTVVALPGIVSPRWSCPPSPEAPPGGGESELEPDPRPHYSLEPNSHPGVAKRQTWNLVAAKGRAEAQLLEEGTTLYCWPGWEGLLSQPPYSSSNCYAGDQFQEQRQITIAPDGTKTVTHFSVFSGGEAAAAPSPWGAQSREYGRPYVKDPLRSDPTGSGAYLSTEIGELAPGQSPPTSCAEVDTAIWSPKRKTFVVYQDDADGTSWVPALEDRKGEAFNTNARLHSERTVSLDDCSGPESTCHWTQVTYSDFDGLGHYRQAVVSEKGQPTPHSSRTEFLPAGQYPGSFIQRAPTQPWILGLYSAKKAWQGSGDVVKELDCFDDLTGFLLRRRLLASGEAEGLTDVVQAFQPNSLGLVTAERYYGGDEEPTIGSGKLCSLTLPTVPDYELVHEYDHGVRVSTHHTGMPYLDLDLEIYPETGRTHISRDVSGVETEFEWDELGRLRFERPAEMAQTEVGYYQPGTSWPFQGDPPAIPVSWLFVRPASWLEDPLDVTTEAWFEFDGFGRRTREERQMQQKGQFSVRTFGWDAMGRSTFESMPGLAAPHIGRTTYLDRDFAGRPRTVRPPDGEDHDRTFAYKGARELQRTVRVRTAVLPAPEEEATTTERYDARGRLVEVVEPNSVVTKYEYDAADRLRRVCQKVVNGTCGQERTFGYDGRGLLMWENLPEMEPKGFGLGHDIDCRYDARGNLVWRKTGSSELSYEYDDGERLREVRGSSGELWKSFLYGSDNASGDRRLGKLVSASRVNRVNAGGGIHPFEVTDTYVYSGRAGRLGETTQAWRYDSVAMDQYTQTVSWTDLGQVESRRYPDCSAICTPAASPYFVTNSFAKGWLSRVAGARADGPGISADISGYHPSGRATALLFGSGMVNQEDADPSGLPRPARLTCTGTKRSSGGPSTSMTAPATLRRPTRGFPRRGTTS